MKRPDLSGFANEQLRRFHIPRQFEFTTLSGLVVVVFLALAVGLQYVLGIPPSAVDAALLAGLVIAAGLVLLIVPVWPMVLALIVGVSAGAVSFAYGAIGPALGVVALGFLFAPSVQIVKHWQQAVVLRLGRFKRVAGPGPHFLIPIMDTIVQLVDMRIRVTDFSAEKSITKDTVPVHVDALAFWMVWDAEKTVLEVQHYFDAVRLSATTALRDTIGKNDLATLLSEREELGRQIQQVLDAKTSSWGITVLSVEFKEILIPKQLEDALSKQAQASRERQSRVILSSAEVEISEKFEQAAERYRENPTAFQLRAMNMVYDAVRTNKNMVIVPSSALDSMGLGTTLGAAALQRTIGQEPPAGTGQPPAGTEDGDEESSSAGDSDADAGGGTRSNRQSERQGAPYASSGEAADEPYGPYSSSTETPEDSESSDRGGPGRTAAETSKHDRTKRGHTGAESEASAPEENLGALES